MYSPITGTGDGSAPVVNITFDYISKDHVKGSVDGVVVALTWTGASQVTFPAAVSNTSTWAVYRETPITIPLVDFTNGSVLTEQDLDLANQQLRFHQEEVDGRIDYTNTANEAAIDASASEAAAATSASQAATSAANANTSAVSAAADAAAAHSDRLAADTAAAVADDVLAMAAIPNASRNASSRASMSALATDVPAILTETGRGGIFHFDGSDLSAEVASDPNEGVYVAAAADPTGASGAWVRQFDGPHNVRWFGAVGDGVTNDSAAFLAAISYLRAHALSGFGYSHGTSELRIPKGHYYLGTTTLDITTTMVITGEGTGGAGGPATLLRWDAGASGFRVQASNTAGASGTQVSDGTGGVSTLIRNMALLGGYTSTDGEFHAVHLRGKASLRDLYIERWEGDGIFAQTSAGSGGATEGNTNNSFIENVYMENIRHGLNIDLADSNVWTTIDINIKSARGRGIWESSFLGNTHIGPHVGASGLESYRVDGGGNRTVILGGYAEGGTPQAYAENPAVIIGGTYAEGFTTTSTALIIAAVPGVDLLGQNLARLGKVRAADPSNTAAQLTVHNSGVLTAGVYSRTDLSQGFEDDGVTPLVLGGVRARPTSSAAATAEGVVEFFTRTYAGSGAVTTRVVLDGPNLSFRPDVDNTIDLGMAGLFRFKSVNATDINATASFKLNGTTVLNSQMAHQADSVAADVATLVADFNALLAKLQSVGLMA